MQPSHPQAFGPDVLLDGPAFIHPTALLYGKVFRDFVLSQGEPA